MLTLEELKNLNRIDIVGRPGSGKSTFALKLSEQLDLPLYHLDKIFFTDHWVKQENEIFLTLQQAILCTPRWIIDGNSLKSLEIRYSTADLVIIFILPKWKCFFRILKRRFKQRNPKIDDRASNCPEQIHWNLIKYTWTFKKRILPLLKELQQKYPHTNLVIINSDDQVCSLPCSQKLEKI